MSDKLFQVKCGIPGDSGTAYVVAKTPTQAYNKLKRFLDKRNLGFSKDRELESITLVAEAVDYPDCETRLLT